MPVRSRSVALGGTAANIARVASRAGLSTALVCRVGSDFPAPFWEALEGEGIDLSAVERVRGAGSPTCYIVEDGAQGQMTLIDQGPMEDARAAAVPTGLLRRARWVHLTTGDPRFQLRVAAAARAQGVPVTADPAQEVHYRWGRRDLARLLSHSELLFGNHHELDAAAALLDLHGPERLVERVPLVVMTLGARGAVAWSRAQTVKVRAVASRVPPRVTGAGDAFRGGFYGPWLGGAPLRDCLGAGARAAARWLRTSPPLVLAAGSGGPLRR